MHSLQLGITTTMRRSTIEHIIAERSGRKWCLFLDRDGVINRQVVNDYVRCWQSFEWLSGAKSALVSLRTWAPHLVVVTNQQGIGKGLMTIRDVENIHERLQEELAAVGVVVDAIRVCPHLESDQCDCRKPNPGLALDWLREHPNVEASLSIMVGDSRSDLEFAHKLASQTGGCATIQITGEPVSGNGSADASFESLGEFAKAINYKRGKERDKTAMTITESS